MSDVTDQTTRVAAPPAGSVDAALARGIGRCRRLPRILIVEDELVIAQDIAAAFGEIGADVVGPTASVQDALRLINETKIDAAIIDVRTRRDLAFCLADHLCERRVPFVLTGNSLAVTSLAGASCISS
jgi:DNA-binding response OmpR family regulator